ncbi:MAG: M3 family oligoendopeptidase [Alphaproteobacteria bacterium]|jgi:oligoendopeptidase F|nr:M3 family oligoendopeptidase [Alphaproteobacteria bacterium]
MSQSATLSKDSGIIDLKDLPEWNLNDLYTSSKDPKIESDLKSSTQQAEAFSKKYSGFFKKDTWTGEDLFEAISFYEKVSETLGRVASFAGLSYYQNLKNEENQRFYQEVQEKLTAIGSYFIFFTLEINTIPDEALEEAIQSSQALKHYEPWLRQVRTFRAHQLSEDLERLLMEKSLTSNRAWNRLFDQTLANMKFIVDGESLTLSEVVELISSKDGKIRRQAATALSDGLSQHSSLLTMVTNVLAKDKEIEDTWRKYPDPASERHLANQVEPEVVDALVSAVKSSYPRLSHRYYQLKAKLLGQPILQYWDRNAPLPEVDDKKISWIQARKTVLDAYASFSPKMAEIGKQFFDKNWIDVPVRDGKTSGAFSHSTVPSVHPYILLNYQGRPRDVTTLAHELGHGIHQVLSAKQGYFLADTPLTIAETASVFGEMLTFRSLLKQENDPLRKRQLLASKVEDMLNTVVRQIAFYEFERQVHTKRRQGELSAEDLGDIWMQTQTEALGAAVYVDPLTRPYWGYISHFIHSPFYVYAYAFGDCLVNSLYAVYEQQPDGFADKYLELLSSGGSKLHAELLAPFGLDAKHPDFWQKGLDMIAKLIDELETLVNGQ